MQYIPKMFANLGKQLLKDYFPLHFIVRLIILRFGFFNIFLVNNFDILQFLHGYIHYRCFRHWLLTVVKPSKNFQHAVLVGSFLNTVAVSNYFEIFHSLIEKILIQKKLICSFDAKDSFNDVFLRSMSKEVCQQKFYQNF